MDIEDLGYNGPDHGRTYSCRFVVGDRTFDTGVGRSKKDAKKEAANLALAELGYTVDLGKISWYKGPFVWSDYYREEYWPFPKWVGNWVRIGNAKVLRIVRRDRTSKRAKNICCTTTIVAFCAARNTAIVQPWHLFYFRQCAHLPPYSPPSAPLPSFDWMQKYFAGLWPTLNTVETESSVLVEAAQKN